MNVDKLGKIAETKSAFALTNDRKRAHEAGWLLYGSFYRLLCHMIPSETPVDLGWGYGYPSELLTATRAMANITDGQTMRHLGEFRGEFNNLSMRIQAEQARKTVPLESIRTFGTLLLEGQELIARDSAASDFVAAKSMDEDLDGSLEYAHTSLVLRKVS